jgi:hypothetical protein
MSLYIESGRTQLFVKTPHAHTVCLVVAPDEQISSLKKKLEIKDGIPVCQQQLVYGGKQLMDDKLMCDYSVGPESTMFLLIRTRGG